MRRAVFFDRDGVINTDYGFIGSIDRFNFVPGVPQALGLLREHGFLLILITNQSGIARGIYTMADYLRVTSYMQQALALHNAQFDGIYCCPHHPEGAVPQYRMECRCRKPKPGLFEDAVAAFDIDPASSYAVGDHARDLEAAAECGVKKLILVGPERDAERQKIEGALAFASLPEFVRGLF